MLDNIKHDQGIAGSQAWTMCWIYHGLGGRAEEATSKNRPENIGANPWGRLKVESTATCAIIAYQEENGVKFE